jgi:phosphotransferase system IIB component
MASSKDICSICNKAFPGKQKFIKCCGSCATRFRLSCLQISDAEYAYYMDSGVSTFKCAECFKLLRVQCNDDTPVKTHSASASDVPRKVVSPERSLVLPPVFESDKFEALSVQVETVRLNGVCTMYLIKSLADMVSKLCGELDHLKNDNACLKNQLKISRMPFGLIMWVIIHSPVESWHTTRLLRGQCLPSQCRHTETWT